METIKTTMQCTDKISLVLLQLYMRRKKNRVSEISIELVAVRISHQKDKI